jgi:arsenate reductase-like glutaredoxin family protein
MMMKNVKKPQVRKVRNRLHHDEIYYTYSNWDLVEIDGVQFIEVVKQPPNNNKLQQIYKMKKDNMEFIK